MKLDKQSIRKFCQFVLNEDIGSGDATTLAIVPENATTIAHFRTREECVCAGMPVLKILFEMLDPTLTLQPNVAEGTLCAPGTNMATISGHARAILTGERPALNFLQRLSGVATITHQYVQALGKSKTVLLDTRKTTPGFRQLEKYAVAMGGGHNHRMGLFDRVMIKDNHREMAKMIGPDSIALAVQACRKNYPNLEIEVEADTLEEVRLAAEAKVEYILLDNMSNDTMLKALEIIAGRAKSEASGNITIERLPSMRNLGLDYISVGALTHSAQAIDIGLDIMPHES